MWEDGHVRRMFIPYCIIDVAFYSLLLLFGFIFWQLSIYQARAGTAAFCLGYE